MPTFEWKGTRSGQAQSGVLTADSKGAAEAMLRRQRIDAPSIREKGKEIKIPKFGGGVPPQLVAIFTRQFSVMIDAGLPLVQCLEILASQQENKFFQKILAGTRAQVEGGATLSAAMRSSPKAFDALYVNMVEAGETCGILVTNFRPL